MDCALYVCFQKWRLATILRRALNFESSEKAGRALDTSHGSVIFSFLQKLLCSPSYMSGMEIGEPSGWDRVWYDGFCVPHSSFQTRAQTVEFYCTRNTPAHDKMILSPEQWLDASVSLDDIVPFLSFPSDRITQVCQVLSLLWNAVLSWIRKKTVLSTKTLTSSVTWRNWECWRLTTTRLMQSHIVTITKHDQTPVVSWTQ